MPQPFSTPRAGDHGQRTWAKEAQEAWSQGADRLGQELRDAVDGLRETFDARPRSRAARGDVRQAILALLAEQPMHGYQLIQEIESRTDGAWKPSPGAVYPALQLLVDEGLITAEESGERKSYSLTEAGKAAAADAGPLPWDTGQQHDGSHTALPKAGAKLAQAVVQVGRAGTPAQAKAAVEVLDEARRKIYTILAEE